MRYVRRPRSPNFLDAFFGQTMRWPLSVGTSRHRLRISERRRWKEGPGRWGAYPARALVAERIEVELGPFRPAASRRAECLLVAWTRSRDLFVRARDLSLEPSLRGRLDQWLLQLSQEER